MHFQLVVPFLQLTVNEKLKTSTDAVEYNFNTVVTVPTRDYYHLTDIENTPLVNGNKHEQEIRLIFERTPSIPLPSNDLFEGGTNLLKLFNFQVTIPPNTSPSDYLGKVTVVVEIKGYVTPAPGNSPPLIKKGKMRLEDAETGVDPIVTPRLP